MSGMSDPFVFENGAASAVLVATIVGSIAAEWAVTYRERRKIAHGGTLARRVGVAAATLVETSTAATRGDKAEDQGTKRVLVGSMIAGFVLGALAARRLPSAELPGSGWLWIVLGALVAWSGIALRAWSIAILGRFFRRDVTVEEGQTVVTGGPYRFVRHPAYAGNLLVALGIGLMLANVVSIVAVVLLPVLGHLPRIRVEEAALDRTLGEPYRRWAAGRARLVPGVW
jgi:protein-S-isoprenylcysteine O-methyltransferase Ste14